MIQQVNLLYSIPKKEIQQYPPSTLFKLLLALIILLLVAYGLFFWRDLYLQKKLIKAQATQKHITEIISNFVSTKPEKKKKLLEETAILKKKLSEKNKLLDVVRQQHHINLTGFSNYLNTFAETITPGVWLTEIEIENGGRDIILTGQTLNSDDVIAFIRALNNNPLFSKTNLQFKLKNLEKVEDKKTSQVWFDFTIVEIEVENEQ